MSTYLHQLLQEIEELAKDKAKKVSKKIRPEELESDQLTDNE